MQPLLGGAAQRRVARSELRRAVQTRSLEPGPCGSCMRLLAVISDETPGPREPVVYYKRGPFGSVSISHDAVTLPFLGLPLPSTFDSRRIALPDGVTGIALFSTLAASSLSLAPAAIVTVTPLALPALVLLASSTPSPTDAQLIEIEGPEAQDPRLSAAVQHLPRQLHGRTVAVGSALHSIVGHSYRIRAVQPPLPLVTLVRTTKVKCAPPAPVTAALPASGDWRQRLAIPLPLSVRALLDDSLSAFLSPSAAGIALLFHGAPGTGKTAAALAVAQALALPHTFIPAASLLRSSEEETRAEIARHFKRAESPAPGALVLDDVDAVCRPRAALREGLERYAVTALLHHVDAALKGQPILLIATARDTASLDAEVLSRFSQVAFPMPTPTERVEILRHLTKRMRASEGTLREVAAASHGFVSADLTALVRYAALSALHASRLPELALGDFTAARRTLQPSLLAQHAAFTQAISLDRIAGMDAVVRALKVTVVYPFANAAPLRALGIANTSGVLLYGPPGCGKTLAARAAARDSGANVIEVQGAEILTKLVGESEKAVARVFARAQQVAPSVLLFDQFEFLGRRRAGDGSSSQTAERIVSCLVAEMDNLRRHHAPVLVLATAAARELLDPALLQPGRLEQQVYVPLPAPADRLAILTQRFASLPVVADEATLRRLVDGTAGFSSAALQLLCEEAALVALRADIHAAQIRAEHFELAMQRKQYR